MINTVTYEQAAEILGVHVQTIKQAIAKGVLTRCLEPKTPASLLTEQVTLFKGKRISIRDLTVQEVNRWEGFKNQALGLDHTQDSVKIIEAVKLHLDDPNFQEQLAELLAPVVRKSIDRIINPLVLSKS